MESSAGQESDASDFWEAVENNDYPHVKEMLVQNGSLAGTNFQPDSLHTDGFPLCLAVRNGHLEMVRLLLEYGADPDAKLAVEDPRELGMPLMLAFHGDHIEIVELLLDHEPNLNAHPYCATPFVDCLFNAMWELVEDWKPGQPSSYRHNEERVVAALFRKSYANYLGKKIEVSLPHDASEQLRLLNRVVGMGGQPTLFTLVRHEQHDIIEQLLRICPQDRGTAMDWPQGTVFQNLCYGASWTGYPKTLDDCRRICPTLYTADVARHSIERAIRSHNRDGGIKQYQQLISCQLEFLRSTNELGESYIGGEPFLPLHLLAEDFIEPSNYGFKCNRLSTPDDLVSLARLFLEFGFDVNSINPSSGQSVLQSAIEKGQPEYAEFLRDNGAE